jgi:hypothetical protein
MEWDPIGVAQVPEAQDEYDCLIGPLMRRLSEGESEARIGDWLIAEVRDHFGLSPNETQERALVAKLKRWWAQATAAP